MGVVSKATMKKGKKKGRPSLLDLQKRVLKQQKLQEQQLQKPNTFNLRSNPRRSSSPPDLYTDPATECVHGDDDDDERVEKKHKLLLGLTSHQKYPTLSAYSFRNSVPNGSDPNGFGEDTEAAPQRRKIDGARFGSNELSEKDLKATDTAHGSQVESGPTTTLPDKKLLVFILDRLQKKDTHGVFSEPVDPEELPDYHDIVENPMDFGTVMAKLDGGAYTNLEQFEKDIFLICANAMKYNAPDTVFFRQARSMQELAKKDFENLRRDSDDSEPEQKVATARRGRPPGKSQKRNPLECTWADISTGATLASQCDDSNSVNGYNLRRGRFPVRAPLSGDPLVRTSTSQLGETLTSWLPEWKSEFPASVLKSVLKSGKNDNIAVNENRRDSYNNHSLSSGDWPSIFATLDVELKQLLAVGLHAEHGYARSLAMFAAGMGPVVWKIVSKKFRSIGGEQGSPWVQENGRLQQQQEQDSLLSVYRRSSDNTIVSENTSRPPCRSTSASNYGISSNFSKHNEDADINRETNFQRQTASLDKSSGGMGSTPCLQTDEKPLIPCRIRGLNGDFGPQFPQEMRMVRLDAIIGMSCSDDSSVASQMQHTPTASCQVPAGDIMRSNQAEMSKLLDGSESRHSHAPSFHVQESTMGFGGKERWKELSTRNSVPFNSDHNIELGVSVPPNSNVQILSQMQPDLMLQL